MQRERYLAAAGGLARSARQLRVAAWHLRQGGIAQLHTWRARQHQAPRGSACASVDRRGHLSFPDWPIPADRVRRPALRVGVILDEFSSLALAYEWNQISLHPADWLSQLDDPPLDLLFVEAAWSGNQGAWAYQLTGSKAPSPALRDLTRECRQRGTPSVFWNKEDPAHYADFLDTARLFDVVFTTDVDSVDNYRRDLGHDRVWVLPFAAASDLHNPVKELTGTGERDVAFAGTYYTHRFPERREQLELLLGAAVRAGSRMVHGLDIFSRMLGREERYQFPAPYDRQVRGSLTYAQMLTAYRAYKVFLNVNSVTSSRSMCARRIFEITASGTPVVSTPSVSIGEFFAADEVLEVADATAAEQLLLALAASPALRDRMVHRAQRRIWAHHTYRHRVNEVLTRVGLDTGVVGEPSVSALVVTNRPHQLEHILGQMAAQQGLSAQVVLLPRGFEPDPQLLDAARERGIAHLVPLTAAADLTLGACLNLAISAADGEVLAKVDDDDLYGPHYLADQRAALGYSGADIVGKAAHYLYLGDLDVTALRFPDREHRRTDFVPGPTLVFHRDLARAVPFADRTRGEDSEFLRSAIASGAQIYSADRFNFVQHRGAWGHTWTVSDVELLTGARVEFFGRHDSHSCI